ncbi:hypothetical protein P9112_000332 [Eukaryota sp. TZLM1-RC]
MSNKFALALSHSTPLCKASHFFLPNCTVYVSPTIASSPNQVFHTLSLLSSCFPLTTFIPATVPDLADLSSFSFVIHSLHLDHTDPFTQLFSVLSQMANIPVLNLHELNLPSPTSTPLLSTYPNGAPPTTYIPPLNAALPPSFVLLVLDESQLDPSLIILLFDQVVNYGCQLVIKCLDQKSLSFLMNFDLADVIKFVGYPCCSNEEFLKITNVVVLDYNFPLFFAINSAMIVVDASQNQKIFENLEKRSVYCRVDSVDVQEIHDKILNNTRNILENYPNFGVVHISVSKYFNQSINLDRQRSFLTHDDVTDSLSIYNSEQLNQIFFSDDLLSFCSFLLQNGSYFVKNRIPLSLWKSIYTKLIKQEVNIADLITLEESSDDLIARVTPVKKGQFERYSDPHLIDHVFSTENPGLGLDFLSFHVFNCSFPDQFSTIAHVINHDFDLQSIISEPPANHFWKLTDSDYVIDTPDYSPSQSKTDVSLNLDDSDTSSLAVLNLSIMFPDLESLSCWGCPLDSIDDVIEGLNGLSNLKALWLNDTPIEKSATWHDVADKILETCPTLEILNSKFTHNYSTFAILVAHSGDPDSSSETSPIENLDLSDRGIVRINVSAFKNSNFKTLSFIDFTINPLSFLALDDLIQLRKLLPELIRVDLPSHLVNSTGKCYSVYQKLGKCGIKWINGIGIEYLNNISEKFGENFNLSIFPSSLSVSAELFSSLIPITKFSSTQWHLLSIGGSLFNDIHNPNSFICPFGNCSSLFSITDMPEGSIFSTKLPRSLFDLNSVDSVLEINYTREISTKSFTLSPLVSKDQPIRIMTTNDYIIDLFRQSDDVTVGQNVENSFIFSHSDFTPFAVSEDLNIEHLPFVINPQTTYNVIRKISSNSCLFDSFNRNDLNFVKKNCSNHLFYVSDAFGVGLPVVTSSFDLVNVIVGQRRVILSLLPIQKQMTRTVERLLFTVSGSSISFVTSFLLESARPFTSDTCYDLTSSLPENLTGQISQTSLITKSIAFLNCLFGVYSGNAFKALVAIDFTKDFVSRGDDDFQICGFGDCEVALNSISQLSEADARSVLRKIFAQLI